MAGEPAKNGNKDSFNSGRARHGLLLPHGEGGALAPGAPAAAAAVAVAVAPLRPPILSGGFGAAPGGQPRVRKEEIRVEVLDARYLVIRTELADTAAVAGAEEDDGRRRGFDRKFRLPGMVDVDSISAEYTHGVLTVTVPRMHTQA
ncbi:18.8 kDa class V heat shock protein [Panicum miliaceum]|uniref:18.8 kDa class V heat shock protein n=1 Tax=Panicum miliaceum TaxID=4540 RepID=A0A3L6R6T7_PANMI|nr:18.8 kDa class V heat shock protein [Panicum miliaceum]